MKRNNILSLIKYRSNKRVAGTVLAVSLLTLSTLITGCGGSSSADSDLASVEIEVKASGDAGHGSRVLVPVATGQRVTGNDKLTLDYSNSGDGYIVTTYKGGSSKVKLQITGSNQTTYTYNITSGLETVIPLSSGSGQYQVTLFEEIGSDQYATNFSDTLDINITNTFGPFLYPNQYVNFNENTKAVSKAESLVSSATCDLEAVAMIYDFVINNVTYDHDEASNVESSYLPDVDEVLSTGKGICFDYAALMAAMLRSQGIPTRLEIGYAKDAYHAWVSVYTEDQGWIGGIIQFDGTKWTLMDPTLASNSKDISKMKDFIGDGSSYTVKYMY